MEEEIWGRESPVGDSSENRLLLLWAELGRSAKRLPVPIPAPLKSPNEAMEEGEKEGD